MLKELNELEIYITPDMAVYKCLIDSGFSYFLFKGGLINSLIVLEELLEFAIAGEEPIIMELEAAEGKLEFNKDKVTSLLKKALPSIMTTTNIPGTEIVFERSEDKIFTRLLSRKAVEDSIFEESKDNLYTKKKSLKTKTILSRKVSSNLTLSKYSPEFHSSPRKLHPGVGRTQTTGSNHLFRKVEKIEQPKIISMAQQSPESEVNFKKKDANNLQQLETFVALVLY